MLLGFSGGYIIRKDAKSHQKYPLSFLAILTKERTAHLEHTLHWKQLNCKGDLGVVAQVSFYL
jgi:hypothetical protein